MKNIILLLIFCLFLVGCQPETIIKYQCQNGQVVDSMDLCSEQKCPECPICPECSICPTKECTNMTIPFVKRTDYQYDFKYGIVDDSTLGVFLETEPLNWGTNQTTKIKNFEDKGGDFTVKHNYRTLKKSATKEVSTHIDSGETKKLSTTFDTEFGEDVEVRTEIIPPTETRHKEVIKYKSIVICNCTTE